MQLAKEQLQRLCGMFLCALVRFKESVPSSYFDSVAPEIMATFLVHTQSTKCQDTHNRQTIRTL